MGKFKIKILSIINYFSSILTDPDRKNLIKILYEFLLCSFANKSIASHYFTCFLYRKQTSNVLDFITEKEAKSVQEKINHPSLSDVASSKLSFIEHFSRGGFPLPKLLAYSLTSKLYMNFGERWKPVDITSVSNLSLYLEELMNFWNIDEIFIKPIRSSGGFGAFKIIKNLLNDKLYLNPLYLALQNNSYVFQEVVQQHPELAKFNPDSLNTVRIDTFRAPEKQAKILSALFRIGRKGSYVDNTSSGGIFVGINIETGSLKSFGYNFFHASEKCRTFRKNPINDKPFEGFIIPFFDELKETVIKAANFLPPALAGWDVAVTHNGPVLIEANILYYGVLGLNFVYGGYKRHPIWQEAVSYANRIRHTK